MGELDPTSEVDLTPLGKVIARLREAVAAYEKDPENVVLLDSLLKRFELTFELSRNSLNRVLKATSVALKDENPTFGEVIRTANQDGLLLGNWEQWHEFRAARNNASYAYDEVKARAIATIVPAFLKEAEYLYTHLRERLKDNG
jgi:nucleotidyltransferase substrate binding protein (TIGR01987 family)